MAMLNVYVYAFIGGIIFLTDGFKYVYCQKIPNIYTCDTKSNPKHHYWLILLAIVMVLCFIVKQKLFALVIFIVCLPNIIGQIFKAHSHSNEQF